LRLLPDQSACAWLNACRIVYLVDDERKLYRFPRQLQRQESVHIINFAFDDFAFAGDLHRLRLQHRHQTPIAALPS